MIGSLRPALLLVLLAVPAFAEDACLGGASLLADQRAIAALRVTTDDLCPCAAASTRGAYRRCAKGLLESVVVDGGLRTECKRTMKDLIKGADCGTGRAPCGKVKPAAKAPLSCRVKRAAACTDKDAYDQTSCDAQNFCADVVTWTAGTCSDPRVRGPYDVGVRVIPLTKDSVVSPGTPRVLDTVVWYPATAGGGPFDNFYKAMDDAPIDGSGGPYPILMFSHGSCGYAAQSTFLLPLIASRGFVVVAPPHPGNTIFEAPACGTPQVQLASFQERPADVAFALDFMLAENGNPGSDFFGLLDPSRIGMSGHSFGGLTTYLVTNQDPRYVAAVPMAPATFQNFALGIPSLTVLGAVDSVVNNAATRDAYAASASPKWLAEVANTGHYAFSDLCPGGPNCVQPTTLTQDEAHAAVLRWVVPFVQWKVGGDERFAAFFSGAPPAGSTLESAP